MANKISSITLMYNEEKCIDMMLNNALLWADEIVLFDGGSTDLTLDIVRQFQEKYPDRIVLIEGVKEIPKAFEVQLKDKYGRVLQNGHFGMFKECAYAKATGDWIFWIDCDEVLSDDARKYLEQCMNNTYNIDVFDVEYIHFVHDFSNIDNSVPIHVGIARFHKKLPDIHWTRYNHTLPEGAFTRHGSIYKSIYIFHLGYAKNLLDIHTRYKRNMLYSEMHVGINQCFWRDWHYYNYAKASSPFKPEDLPKAIKERFEIGVYERLGE